MRIIIFGPPGTGKGTQAKQIAKHFHLTYFSTGDYFREEYKRQTVLGIKAYIYWKDGNLVPDILTLQIVEKNIPADNYILDGYPRTLVQAQALEKKRETDIVLYLHTEKEELLRRLLRRAHIEGRYDDTKDVIKKRIQIYEQETEPLLAFYKEKIARINGNEKQEVVLKEILGIIKKK